MSQPAQSVLIVAAEASGDLHAAGLWAELKKKRPELRAFGMGGSKLQNEPGFEAIVDTRELSVMGIVEVLPALPRIFRAMNTLKRAARERRPEVAILVDSPDFNLRLAKDLHALGIPVVYYVSPTVWAWRKGRIATIQRYVSRMLCILPFEESFYAKAGVAARYVGNPVLDEWKPPLERERLRTALGMRIRGQTLALLPGSRQSEVRRILPAMMEAAELLRQERTDLEVVVPVAPTIPEALIKEIIAPYRWTPTLVHGRAPEVVAASDAAVVASGTAVLEAALMGKPLVVVYRVSRVTWWIARLLVRVAHVALVNLLAGREIVPELLQDAMKPARIAAEVRRLFDDEQARAQMLAALEGVRATLGPAGASQRAAEEVDALMTRKEKTARSEDRAVGEVRASAEGGG
jgi:lipid-A-disaccharide synthase